ncbi:Cadherin 87A, partial [Carabus blaptoides fortunei]
IMTKRGYPVLIFLLVFTTTCQICNGNLPPIFSMDMNNQALYESTPVGDVVYRLEGYDPEGFKVHYGLVGTDRFKVDRDSGEVTIAKPLDREVNDTLRFLVTLEDETNGTNTANNIVRVAISVIILDDNDNAPLFKDVPYEAVVPEDTPVGTTVFRGIRVEDPDTVGETLEVKCINQPQSGDACSKFELETVSAGGDHYQGVLILRQTLDYGEKQFYQLMLQASDGELNSTTSVEIKVEDVQNTPPKFVGSLTGVVKEDAPINTLVMTVQARDGDRGMPRKVVYELLSNPMDYFLLDAITGELRTAKPLDKEALEDSTGVLTLGIRARELVNGERGNDPLTTTSAEATVTIKDVNDEPPQFNQREYNVEIPENVPNGTPLPHLDMSVKDPDVGSNSVFSLRLEDISGAFAIDPTMATGSTPVSIRVSNGSLDYENPNQRKFIVLVVAEEVYTNPRLSSTATVTVSITDANDNAPTFDNEVYTATVSETASPGTLVTTITAKDRDSGRFGENGIIYQLFGNGAERFSVNNRTGVITVAHCDDPGNEECLDFETKPVYFLSYKAIDDDGKGQTTSVPLRITLTDSNDNAPVFINQNYRAVIDEGAMKFEPDLQVQARDVDKTSEIIYSIIAGNVNNIFSIEPQTGKIIVANINGLDMTNVTSNVIMLTIEANDGKYTSTCMVNITVHDVNNNAPVFSRESYITSVSENTAVGTSLETLTATDSDSGINAEIKYRIQKGAFDDFNISDTGLVSVARKLDYDRRNTYHIEVIGVDQGTPSLTGTTTLTVSILNSNDKLPYFVPATQRAEIPEDAAPGTPVHTLIAMDPDVNSSEALNFAATEPISAVDKNGKQVVDNEIFKDFFSVDHSTGQVTVHKPLERDVAAVVRITVLVTDITAPTMQQGKGTLVITIVDVNDFPPTFAAPWTPEHPNYSLTILEEQPIGSIVATYTATDIDSNIAEYVLEPEHEYFEIDNTTAIVRIKKRIDYEETKYLNFSVIAYDSGIPQLSATANVNVTIENVNDMDPVFSQSSYEASVKENAPTGTHIITVNATDDDDGDFGKITFSLIGEHSTDFHIDAATGEITVANTGLLDREVISDLTIQVVASDGAPLNSKRTISVPVHIKIIDVNDNPPMFDHHNYHASIVENLRLNPPAPILQVQAKDPDQDINGAVHYTIISGNEGTIFSLDPETGILYPHASLIGQARHFHLVVEARDGEGNGQFTDHTAIDIEVLDVNQDKPVFIMPALANATVEVPENAARADYLVMTVKAIDKDTGENGRVTYHLKVNNHNVLETDEFIIDSDTGELRTKIFLDREVKSKYELVLVAMDHGSPTWYETLRFLTVLLVDTNDNLPEFPDSAMANPYRFYVKENSNKDIRIGKVQAIDKDEGKHAKVYYYIYSGNEDGGFYLDKSDGSLYTNKSFDREVEDEYDLLILANNDPDFFLSPEEKNKMTDDEVAHDSGVAKVKITIQDENDNPPGFEKSDYYAGVNTMANIKEFVATLPATDPDLGTNGSLTYFIRASNLYKFGSSKSSGSIVPSPFNITQDGKLVTSNYMAEYNQDRFIIEVVAKELAAPEREALARVHVWIFEPDQLIRVILSRPPEEVNQERDEIIAELSNVTQSLVVVDEIRYHVDANGHINQDWCDMYIHVVDGSSQTIATIPEVLKVIDAKYDALKDYYAGFAIENVVPAFIDIKEESFDPALAALIALLIVLFVGIITFIVVCCCLRHWVITIPSDLKKKDALIKKAIIDDLNTTENPLWIEQKLKLYEEQELTMQVFNEPEQVALERHDSVEYTQGDNTYATIQHPTRRGSSNTAAMSIADDIADYATLSGLPHNSGSSHSSLSRVPNFYEAAMGFQGSTFQVPEPADSRDGTYNRYQSNLAGSGLRINEDGQPEYVAELM